jgi:hypothetical protein
MKATLRFQNNKQATEFSMAWSRFTSGGHTLGDTEVTVYNVDESGKKFINNYITKLNK